MGRLHPPARYLEVLPRAPLVPYVRCFWALSAHASVPLSHRVLPDGCLDLVVEFGPGGRAGRASLEFVGTMSTASVVPLHGAVSFLGIRFQPGGAHPLLRLPLHELTDGQLALGALWSRDARECEERLCAAGGLAARVALLEEWLLRRLALAGQKAAREEVLVHAVRLIRGSRGQVRIDALEESLGVGSRRLERRFRDAVGLSPKALCRVERMRHAVDLLAARPSLPGAELALAAGYFDQAHLGREFRALTGLSPGAWARERSGVGFVQAEGEDTS